MATAVSVSVSQSSWSSCVDCSTLTASMEKSPRSLNFTEREKRYFCRGKTFVATNIILSRQNKLTSVATNARLSRQSTCFVTTKVCLSRQTRISRDAYHFVAASILLSRHVTKMILVAALANDKPASFPRTNLAAHSRPTTRFSSTCEKHRRNAEDMSVTQ